MKKFSAIIAIIFLVPIILLGNNLIVKKTDNGVTVIMKVVPTSDVTAIRAFVKTGSMYEDSLLGCGISHYFEHIMAGGTTKKRTEAQYDSLKQQWGAWYNAYTTTDHTAYYFVVPSKYSYEAAEALTEWIVYPAFDPGEIAREKGVIQKEILMGDTPDERIWDDMMDAFVQNHPIKFPVIGYLELFNSITRDNILKYYETRYTPDNTAIVIAGNFDPDSMFSLMERCFKDYKRRPVYLPHIPDYHYQSVSRKVVKHYNIKKYEYYRAYHVPALNHPDIIPLKVLAAFLGSKENELYDYLVNDKAWVKDFGTFVYTSQIGGGGFYFYFDTDRKDYVDSAYTYIDKYLKKLKRKGIPQSFIKNYARSSELSYRKKAERMENLVDFYGIGYVRYNNPLYYDDYHKKLYNIKSSDLKRVLVEYLKDDNKLEFIALPESDLKIKKGMEEKFIVEKNCKKVLDNKATVIYRLNDDNLVSVRIIIRGGGSAYDSIPGEADLLAKMIAKGSKKYDEKYIARFFKGSGFNVSAGTGYMSISYTLLRDDLKKSLIIINDIMRHPRMDKKEFLVEKDRMRFNLENIKTDDNETYSFNEFGKIYFNGTPYYNRFAKSGEMVENITLESLKNRWRRICSPDNMIFGVYGVKDTLELKSVTDILFKGLKESTDELKIINNKKGVSRPKGIKTFVYNHPQVNIYMAYPAPDMNDSLYIPYRVFMAFFSGNTNVLHKALRGENDLVYYSYGYVYSNIFNGAAGIFVAQTSYDKKDEVLKIMKNTIDRIKNGDFTSDDLENVKKEFVNKLAVWYQSSSDQLDRDVYYEFIGLGYDYFDRYKDAIKNVTRNDIEKVVKTYCKGEPFIFIALPKEEK